MTEPKKVEYIVVNVDDDAVVYRTDDVTRAEGYAECLKEQCDTRAVVAQIVRV